MRCNMIGTYRKTASRRSLRNPIRCFDQAGSAAAFFFLRQPSRPNAPRPLAKRGKAAGKGVVVAAKLAVPLPVSVYPSVVTENQTSPAADSPLGGVTGSPLIPM